MPATTAAVENMMTSKMFDLFRSRWPDHTDPQRYLDACSQRLTSHETLISNKRRVYTSGYSPRGQCP
jgi:hypothetical protein